MLKLNVFQHFLTPIKNVTADCLASSSAIPFLERVEYIPVMVNRHALVEASIRKPNRPVKRSPGASRVGKLIAAIPVM